VPKSLYCSVGVHCDRHFTLACREKIQGRKYSFEGGAAGKWLCLQWAEFWLQTSISIVQRKSKSLNDALQSLSEYMDEVDAEPAGGKSIKKKKKVKTGGTVTQPRVPLIMRPLCSETTPG